MATAYASKIIEAPVEAVWDAVRDFNGLPSWHPVIDRSEIEDGLDADVVGAVRSLHLKDGAQVRERLLMLDDSRYAFAYNFEKPAFPVTDYVAHVRLVPVTDGDRTFAEWRASFDEAPEDRGKYQEIISTAVFQEGLEALAEAVPGRAAAADAVRWHGWRPAKVFCSAVLRAPLAKVWARIRDFAGMAAWHPEIRDMTMLAGARSDKVSGVRDFRFGDGALHEQLTMLCDRTHAFRYKINKSPMPWLHYHAGVELHPISATDETFAVLTADWVASPNDDVALIPRIHHEVFQRAFDTLNDQLR